MPCWCHYCLHRPFLPIFLYNLQQFDCRPRNILRRTFSHSLCWCVYDHLPHESELLVYCVVAWMSSNFRPYMNSRICKPLTLVFVHVYHGKFHHELRWGALSKLGVIDTEIHSHSASIHVLEARCHQTCGFTRRVVPWSNPEPCDFPPPRMVSVYLKDHFLGWECYTTWIRRVAYVQLAIHFGSASRFCY